MLELIRKYRALFSVIFVASATGMVVSMFGAPARRGGGDFSGGNLGSGVAAKVEGEEISTRDLMMAMNQQQDEMERLVEEQVEKSPNKAETRKMLMNYVQSQLTPDHVLSQLVRERFMDATAAAAGIITPPEAVADLIQNNPQFQKNGRFDPLTYRQLVAEPGRYEESLADRAKVANFNRLFQDSLTIASPQETSQDELIHKKRKFETLTIMPTAFPEPKSVSPAEVAAFVADPASKTKLQTYYDRNISKYKTDEQVHARHILIREAEGGQKKAAEVLQEIKSGKIAFEAAAAKYSSDKSNAGKGGDLGFFGKGMMDPAFEKAAFELKDKNAITDQPVKSSFGYHLIQLVDRKPAVSRTLDQVKNEIAQTVLLEDKKAQNARAWITSFTNSGKAPSDAELKKLGLKWNPVEWAPLDERLGPVGSIDEHRSELLALNSAKPVLAAPLTQGESLVLVRYAGEAEPAKDAKAPDSPGNAKAQRAYEYFLSHRYETLEKNKQIVRSQSALAELSTRMKPVDDGG